MCYEICPNTHHVNVLFRLLSVIHILILINTRIDYANQLTVLVRRQFSFFLSHSIFSLVAIYAHHVFAVQSI